MRIVLDTNVIIAAFATRGLCADVLELCLSGHTLVTSEFILSEIREKLSEKLHLPESIIQDIISYLHDNSEIVVPARIVESMCRDKDDVEIIGTAVSGKANFIITGDEDLLVLINHEQVKIMTPRAFWEFLRQSKP
ncbi:MAG: putative toxin-antitoxin system toxin component, PIN family [Planctomycetia bacterium]|nr:putative toxin-antitoxin system toxin component, PIN family [Planctomycetia bacterium]